MRKLMILAVLPTAMLVGCNKTTDEAAVDNVATEEVVAPSESVDNLANATDNMANAVDEGSTDLGSTDHGAAPAADGSTDHSN